MVGVIVAAKTYDVDLATAAENSGIGTEQGDAARLATIETYLSGFCLTSASAWEYEGYRGRPTNFYRCPYL